MGDIRPRNHTACAETVIYQLQLEILTVVSSYDLHAYVATLMMNILLVGIYIL